MSKSVKVGNSCSWQGGFTLLEMIVVLVIVGLLMGLVGPRLFCQADKAKVQTADTQVKMLKGALLTMRLDIGRLPTEQEGLALLNEPPADERSRAFWSGPYLEGSVPLDPWGRRDRGHTSGQDYFGPWPGFAPLPCGTTWRLRLHPCLFRDRNHTSDPD